MKLDQLTPEQQQLVISLNALKLKLETQGYADAVKKMVPVIEAVKDEIYKRNGWTKPGS